MAQTISFAVIRVLLISHPREVTMWRPIPGSSPTNGFIPTNVVYNRICVNPVPIVVQPSTNIFYQQVPGFLIAQSPNLFAPLAPNFQYQVPPGPVIAPTPPIHSVSARNVSENFGISKKPVKKQNRGCPQLPVNELPLNAEVVQNVPDNSTLPNPGASQLPANEPPSNDEGVQDIPENSAITDPSTPKPSENESTSKVCPRIVTIQRTKRGMSIKDYR